MGIPEFSSTLGIVMVLGSLYETSTVARRVARKAAFEGSKHKMSDADSGRE